MSDFELSSTSGTPGVSFKAAKGDCKFTGYSIPQKVNEFYEPILNWLTAYQTEPAKQTTFIMAMEYMDNASRKIFDNIFKILGDIQKNGSSNVSVQWFTKDGDEDMLGLGRKFEKAVNLPFAYDTL